jgi:DNA gyrase/topoisomerase IV subunit A
MANMFKRKVKKLTNLQLKEISGVDHPASLHEGWAVIKSSDNELDAAFVEALENDPQTMEKNVETETTESEVVGIEETPVEKEKDDVRKELDDVRKELADARSEVDSLRENSEMEKAVRDSQKWAIIPQLDPVEFAPVLRSLRANDSESSEKIEEILDAVAVSLGEAGILKELGSEGTQEHDDAYGQIEAMAKTMVETGVAKSLADGISRVAKENPELYSAYVAEMGA